MDYVLTFIAGGLFFLFAVLVIWPRVAEWIWQGRERIER